MQLDTIFQASNSLLNLYSNCQLCPHQCGVNRNQGEKGYCGSTSQLLIASICAHYGEEPVISGSNGICNVFFGRCNLSCKFCQNHQISKNKGDVLAVATTVEKVVEQIIEILLTGCHSVGFVSPTHYTPHVQLIIDALRKRGYHPVFVYNTNCYDHVEVLKSLEGYIDVYLPDFKYADSSLALKLSGIKNYREIAGKAFLEMFRQKGATLRLNEEGLAESGIIVRHLVLPGFLENSIEVLRILADVSISLSVSLMSQYNPLLSVAGFPELSRKLYKEEYELVVNEFERLGFYKGWLQEFESSDTYLPDFENPLPFKL